MRWNVILFAEKNTLLMHVIDIQIINSSSVLTLEAFSVFYLGCPSLKHQARIETLSVTEGIFPKDTSTKSKLCHQHPHPWQSARMFHNALQTLSF